MVSVRIFGVALAILFVTMVDGSPVKLKLFHHCTKCLPGFGLVALCNSTHRTQCEPCPEGTWTPKHDHLKSCSPCSQCGEGLYEDRPCAATHDTVCDSCETSKGHLNADFLKKCQDSARMMSRQSPFAEGDSDEIPLTRDNDPHHKFWLKKGEAAMMADVKFKPSNNHYDLERLITWQRRKAIILIALCSLALTVVAVFFACFTYRRNSRRAPAPKHFYTLLTDQDRSIIHQCAQRLEVERLKAAGKAVPRFKSEDEQPLPVHITENPLEDEDSQGVDNPCLHKTSSLRLDQ